MTSLQEWSRNAPFQKELGDLLQKPALASALSVLENSNLPGPAAVGASVESLALLHQYQAGYHAALKSLRNLPGITAEKLSQIDRAAKLEASGPWSHATAKISQPSNE